MKNKFLLVFVLWFSYTTNAQLNQFKYKRPINGVIDTWHRIPVPNALFGKINTDFSDLRIISITKSKDTIEVPYFVEENNDLDDEFETKSFNLLNNSSTKDGHYFTFEIPTIATINQIVLNFNNPNYDWNIQLEGSNDQRSWFTITKAYRIVGIANEHVDFNYGSIDFPNSNYQYYRLFIPNNGSTPELASASTNFQNLNKQEEHFKEIKPITYTVKKENKQTHLFIELPYLCPVNQIALKIATKQDYYRPIQFFFQTDSTVAETGVIYNYTEPIQDILFSKNKPIYTFPTTFTKEIHIAIDNEDNSPLSIEGVTISGRTYALVARFDQKGEHFLVYGNSETENPHYDIVNFKESIPVDLKKCSLGSEETLKMENPKHDNSLFSGTWLWGIMLTIIGIVGFVTYRMLRHE